MVTVITYGTFDLLHEGHIKLLQRAKALGNYLIVGITSDTFDKERGKINVSQSLSERITAVKNTGLADQIIVEEYEGQKIDDIKRYNVDIFTVGSDWVGKFDYLNSFCKVVYLPRTEGISSSRIRSIDSKTKIGVIGSEKSSIKFINEASFVNGAIISGAVGLQQDICLNKNINCFSNYEDLLDASDAVYIVSQPQKHYQQIKEALNKGKHVICQSPITMNCQEWTELKELSKQKGLFLTDAIKTAYSTAYYRLLLIIKGNVIGDVVSIDATSTSLENTNVGNNNITANWPSFCDWGVINMLPVFQILGCDYKAIDFVTRYADKKEKLDLFTKADFIYGHATATIKSGIGIKSEGDLVVSGTKGYIYVPAPWWKTDYFEIRYENPSDNRKVFYQLEGEGIRYEILSFVKSIRDHKDYSYISDDVSKAIVKTVESYYAKKNVTSI